MYALQGAWNSHLSMVRCDADGAPLPDAPTVELWKVCDLCFLFTVLVTLAIGVRLRI